MLSFLNLQARSADVAGELHAALARSLGRGAFILGEEVTAFERSCAKYLGARHAIGVASGTDAITLALLGLGVGAGDDVVTVSHTSVATVVGIERSGARVIFADVDAQRHTLCPASLARAATQATRAIVAVHLYGHPADMDAIRAFAKPRGIFVVEDAAQAHGAAVRGEKAGTLGDAAAFSFYPTKNLGACGDGGAVVTASEQVAARVRQLREYGWGAHKQLATARGMNSRLDELQAGFLRVFLARLDAGNARRRAIAAYYDDALRGHPAAVRAPTTAPDHTHAHHLYVVRSPERDALADHLRAAGIETRIHYPHPVHLQPAYATLRGADAAPLPTTEQLAREILSLPLHPWLRDDDVSRVEAALRSFRPPRALP